jgi:beta-fructofuranosidase
MAPVAVLQPSSSLLSSDGGLVTATDLATGGDVERPQSSGLAMDIHVPGHELELNMTATIEHQTAAEESEDLQQKRKYQRHRTSFHYQPAKNWMNDPNAPMYYKGYYHLFYQYNPHAAVWGNITWGHAVSEDLIHWRYLEDALEPDQWYDAMGVWSGSATIDNDGIPFILYTGGSGRVDHISEQLQCMAVPADPTDPLLRKWVKVANNPIITRPLDVGEQDFRDPSTAWQQSDGTWIFTVGAKRGSTGVALQYRSKDTKNWELEEKLLHSGNSHGMWECVDFFPVDYDTPTTTTVPLGDTQKYIFKISLFDEKQDYYIVGTYDELAQKFSPDHPDHDIGLGFLLDYGSYYASKSFFDPVKNRHITWAWVPESCTQEMDIQKGWSSILGVPRTLVLESKTGGANLLQWPIEEIDSLRGCKISRTDVKLDAGAIVEIKGAAGDQLDVEVVFDYPDVSSVQAADEAKFNNGYDCSQAGYANQGIFGPFGLLVLTDKNFQEQTAVFFYIVHLKDGRWTTRFCNDQSRYDKRV